VNKTSSTLKARLTPSACLPEDHDRAVLVGRIWDPAQKGPTLVRVQADGVYDLSPVASTASELLNLPEPIGTIVRRDGLMRIAPFEEVLANSACESQNAALPWFLAPCDLQAIKASGVTFIASMLERVIEEQARGDAVRADAVRKSVVEIIGPDLSRVTPGSSEAQRIKDLLISRGLWSQYLEVGIGPDAEIFTKAQPMSAVGVGAEVGIHSKSEWSNPEPEIVLAVNSGGNAVGATLGNDVNLRDFEGRSALLLGKAKDNNASCAIGPFIRLFDEHYSMDDVRACELDLRIEGPEGFSCVEAGSMSTISRDPLELVRHAMGKHHQYPDGMMLFLGTMFAPTEDRSDSGKGFTHRVGDVVTVKTPRLGTLVNRVNHADKVAPWTFGSVALIKNLAARRLVSSVW
jgi:fumarylacetoacetate (FAA) hydrolase family protein